jgi:hypothetical protein
MRVIRDYRPTELGYLGPNLGFASPYFYFDTILLIAHRGASESEI